jgi:hypothetical protein
VAGLGSAGYISSVDNFVSSLSLQSTVAGLGSAGYISSVDNFVSSLSLQSTVAGLGSAGYISSYANLVSTPSLQSTVAGLGSAGYISSYANLVSTPSLQSTVAGLGEIYISSLLAGSNIDISNTQTTFTISLANDISGITSLTVQDYISSYSVITHILYASSIYVSTLYYTNLDPPVQGGGISLIPSTLSASYMYYSTGFNFYIKNIDFPTNQANITLITSTPQNIPLTGINNENPQVDLDVSGNITASKNISIVGALAVGGNVAVGGDMSVYGTFYNPSDERIKKNVAYVDTAHCAAILKQLALHTYNMIDDEPARPSTLGFIAQEVETVLPAAVKRGPYKDIADFATVNKDQLHMIHYGATQKLFDIIGGLEERVRALEADNKLLYNMIESVIARSK